MNSKLPCWKLLESCSSLINNCLNSFSYQTINTWWPNPKFDNSITKTKLACKGLIAGMQSNSRALLACSGGNSIIITLLEFKEAKVNQLNYPTRSTNTKKLRKKLRTSMLQSDAMNHQLKLYNHLLHWGQYGIYEKDHRATPQISSYNLL